MTRTVKFGNPSEDAQNIYKTVLKAEQSAIEAIKPGVMIKTLIKLLEILLAKRDAATISLIDWATAGLEEHEYQDVSSANENPLEAGMVITIEPGIYVLMLRVLESKTIY